MARPLAILRLAYVINSLEAGGAQYPVPRIVKALRDHGIAATVYALSMRDGLAAKRLDAAGVSWVCAPAAKTAHWKASRWLMQTMKDDKPDVIWTSLTQATLIGQRVGKKRQIPVISWQHNAFLKPINRWLLRRQRGLSQFWIADSQSVLDFAVAEIGLSPSDFLTLPLFVVSPYAPQAKIANATRPFRWVSVGRLHPNKNYAPLIDALASLKTRTDWSLTIAGEGAEREPIEARIAANGLSDHISLSGHVEGIPDFLAGAHGYIQPSRNEGLCIAAHEAMAAGLPCIVTDTGQMPRTLMGSPAIVPIGDMSAIAAQMAEIMDNPEQQRQLSELSRQRVFENFGPDSFDAAIRVIAERLHRLA